MITRIFRHGNRILNHTVARSFSTETAPNILASSATQHIDRVKHKIPRKRASKLLSILQKEEMENLIDNRVYPEIKTGDSIEIEILPYITAKIPDIIRGIVIGISNRKSDTLIRLINAEEGSPVERAIFKYNPLVKRMSVLQAGYFYRNKKSKFRRSKRYDIVKLRPKLFTIK